MDKETKEWLGLTKADLCIYIAFALSVIGCFFGNIFIFSILFLLAMIFGIYSAFLGMTSDPELSRATNAIKKIAYPLVLIVIISIIIIKYLINLGIIKLSI